MQKDQPYLLLYIVAEFIQAVGRFLMWFVDNIFMLNFMVEKEKTCRVKNLILGLSTANPNLIPADQVVMDI